MPINSYFEPSDDDHHFPAIDSLSPQGMFQFTVAKEHPIRGVQIFQRLCDLYQEKNLYFVVPPHRFKDFKKQKLLGTKGNSTMANISGLKQYVLELDVGLPQLQLTLSD
jgi:hypothetical protein